MLATMTAIFEVRVATVADVDVLARHRAEMFRDIHSVSDETCAAMAVASRAYFQRAIPAGEFLGWLAHQAHDPTVIVAGAGLQLRPALPTLRKLPEMAEVTSGQQGLIVNVYTEHDWRRHGLAALLMSHVLNAAKVHDLGSLVLHASADGRPLYEKLGFVPTNEMRYSSTTASGIE
jgi:GNAT superfamily N-acetyltransferase